MTVRQTLGELLNYHRVAPRSEVHRRGVELLDLVQLPSRTLELFPASMSGVASGSAWRLPGRCP